ncbi:MAG TPA: alpha/beta hydrolase [Streptosporangiaceae bacterium]
MNVEQVSFPSGALYCAADLYLPEAAGNGTPVPGVVMGHSVIMVKEALRPHAEYLVRAGFAVLAIDYRTIGSSEGEPRCQWFPERQAEDMRAAVSCLAARAEVDPGRIGAWGHSTAAGVAIVAGALDRRIAAVACQNPSMLDGWTALEKTQGRTQMGKVRALMQQDFERRLRTGEGASIPAIASADPKLAGYVAQAEELFPTFRNQMTVESLEHVLLWAPVNLIHRLAPTPLLMVTGVDDQVHAIDEVLRAYDRAWQPKRLELLQVDEFGLSIEPGLGQSMNLAAGFFDEHLRRAPRFVPSPAPEEARSRGLRPEYQKVP